MVLESDHTTGTHRDNMDRDLGRLRRLCCPGMPPEQHSLPLELAYCCTVASRLPQLQPLSARYNLIQKKRRKKSRCLATFKFLFPRYTVLRNYKDSLSQHDSVRPALPKTRSSASHSLFCDALTLPHKKINLSFTASVPGRPTSTSSTVVLFFLMAFFGWFTRRRPGGHLWACACGTTVRL